MFLRHKRNGRLRANRLSGVLPSTETSFRESFSSFLDFPSAGFADDSRRSERYIRKRDSGGGNAASANFSAYYRVSRLQRLSRAVPCHAVRCRDRRPLVPHSVLVCVVKRRAAGSRRWHSRFKLV